MRVSGEKKIGHPIQKSAVMSETGWYKKIDSQCYLSIMQLCQRLEQILNNLRPAFSREATFQWFILLVWGVVLNSQPSAITSYVNAIGWTESYYNQALHWFDSKAFSVEGLTLQWSKWLSQHESLYRIKGKRVYVGDGIKVGKEGRKMPGVKRLHQESEDVSKPEWIRGHYFNALTILQTFIIWDLSKRWNRKVSRESSSSLYFTLASSRHPEIAAENCVKSS